MTNNLTQLCKEMQDEVIAWRHHLHKHPELGFKEFETTTFIEEKLRSFGGIEVTRPTPTGVVGILKGGLPGKTLAFRADIDALPILEDERNTPRSETDGIMHACGHDAHTAVLLGACSLLAKMKDTICGEIRFIFQPAEEVPPGGAAAMVDAGVMKGVDYVFAMHFDVTAEPGTFMVKPGVLYASTYTFDIDIKGRNAHAAFPFNGIDSLLIASNIVVALNGIIPRYINNAQRSVLSVTQIHGGNAHNIIPENVSIAGTIRILDKACERVLLERVRTITEGICAMHGASCELKLEKHYGLVESDAQAAAGVKQILETHFGKENVKEPVPLMGGEDFSAYLQEVPGCYYRAGTRKVNETGEACPPHQSRYQFNDASIPYAVESVSSILLEISDMLDKS